MPYCKSRQGLSQRNTIENRLRSLWMTFTVQDQRWDRKVMGGLQGSWAPCLFIQSPSEQGGLVMSKTLCFVTTDKKVPALKTRDVVHDRSKCYWRMLCLGQALLCVGNTSVISQVHVSLQLPSVSTTEWKHTMWNNAVLDQSHQGWFLLHFLSLTYNTFSLECCMFAWSHCDVYLWPCVFFFKDVDQIGIEPALLVSLGQIHVCEDLPQSQPLGHQRELGVGVRTHSVDSTNSFWDRWISIGREEITMFVEQQTAGVKRAE